MAKRQRIPPPDDWHQLSLLIDFPEQLTYSRPEGCAWRIPCLRQTFPSMPQSSVVGRMYPRSCPGQPGTAGRRVSSRGRIWPRRTRIYRTASRPLAKHRRTTISSTIGSRSPGAMTRSTVVVRRSSTPGMTMHPSSSTRSRRCSQVCARPQNLCGVVFVRAQCARRPLSVVCPVGAR